MQAKRKQKSIKPRWLRILWGGFNAGVIMGIFDGLMVIFFGLARFDRTGEIVGFLLWDAIGLGFLGVLCTAFMFFGVSRLIRLRPRIVSVVNLLLLLTLSALLTIYNVGWSFQSLRGTPPINPKHIILLTLDTLRTDSTGMGGNPLVRTPWLDRLSQKGRQYINAVCPVPMTTPSHASMLTSTIPAVHGAAENRYRLHSSNETLTEVLRSSGYRTAAFVSCFPLDSRFGLDQGFMLYHDQFGVPGDLRQASWFLFLQNLRSANRMERNCRWTNSLALPWIRKYTGDNVPIFLWIHYFDPHSPYSPPKIYADYYKNCVHPRITRYPDAFAEENARRATRFDTQSPVPGRPEELYLGEITEMDRAIGDVLKQLAKSDVLKNAVIAALADHGESFGEHGFFYSHGEDIYEPALSIPLIMYSGFPYVQPGIDTRLACASDIATTLLPATGLSPGTAMEGFNLMDDSRIRQSALVENYGIIMNSRATKQRGLRTAEHKAILHLDQNKPELFNLSNDPGETVNVAGDFPEFSVELKDRIVSGFSSADHRQQAVSEDLSPETLMKLESLGYMIPGQ